MDAMKLYRKRLIPDECIWLKDDEIIKYDSNVIITKWKTLKPKNAFDHGCSCYFLDKGLKVSKFYKPDGSLLFWYCDICQYDLNAAENTLTATDLLADVIVYPDGRYTVVDLDEMSQATAEGIISREQLVMALRTLDYLLNQIYRNKFDELQTPLEELDL